MQLIIMVSLIITKELKIEWGGVAKPKLRCLFYIFLNFINDSNNFTSRDQRPVSN